MSIKYFITEILCWNYKKFFTNCKSFYSFIKDYRYFKKNNNYTIFPNINLLPILNEKSEFAGSTGGPYFKQDLFIAQKIFKANPNTHFDIASRVDGFVAHIASFREIFVFDIREMGNTISNVQFKKADIMNLDEGLYNITDSVSSLHAIEHFGLVRYGDPLDVNGHVKAIQNIHSMLKLNGVFYFSTPIGEPKIEYNAHRVFSISYLKQILLPLFNVESFAYINDSGDLLENVDLNSTESAQNFNCKLGCGIFELRKK